MLKIADLLTNHTDVSREREVVETLQGNRATIVHHIVLSVGEDTQTGIQPHVLPLVREAQELNPPFFKHPFYQAWAEHAARSAATGNLLPYQQLGNFAAAATLLGSDQDFSIETVTDVDGAVFLPTIGRLFLHAADERATIQRQSGEVSVRSGDTEEILPPDLTAETAIWKPTQKLSAVAEADYLDDPLRIDLDINDLPFFRTLCYGTREERLTPEEHAKWQTTLEAAWELLVTHHRKYAIGLAAGMQAIIPLQTIMAGQGRSATTRLAFGAAFISEPPNENMLAGGLVHEFEHNRLNIILDILRATEIIQGIPSKSDDSFWFYAPWRDDPRQGHWSLLHGSYAHLAVSEFLAVQQATAADATIRSLQAVQFARWNEAVSRATATLKEADHNWGEQFLAHINERLAAMEHLELPEGVREQAALEARDHEASWRLHNLKPYDAAVEDLAAAFVLGVPVPSSEVPTSIRTENKGKDFQFVGQRSRVSLRRRMLTAREKVVSLANGGEDLKDDVPQATMADAHLVLGNLERARQLYAEQIIDDPHAVEAWAGLVAARAPDAPRVAQPEVGAAVYARLSPEVRKTTSPEALLDWLAE